MLSEATADSIRLVGKLERFEGLPLNILRKGQSVLPGPIYSTPTNFSTKAANEVSYLSPRLKRIPLKWDAFDDFHATSEKIRF